jgi:hypothetical protein
MSATLILCRLTRAPPLGHLCNLMHLSLAYNNIQDFTDYIDMKAVFPPSLISLDLSHNQLHDVQELVQILFACEIEDSLRLLWLQVRRHFFDSLAAQSAGTQGRLPVAHTKGVAASLSAGRRTHHRSRSGPID